MASGTMQKASIEQEKGLMHGELSSMLL